MARTRVHSSWACRVISRMVHGRPMCADGANLQLIGGDVTCCLLFSSSPFCCCCCCCRRLVDAFRRRRGAASTRAWAKARAGAGELARSSNEALQLSRAPSAPARHRSPRGRACLARPVPQRALPSRRSANNLLLADRLAGQTISSIATNCQ